jgi:hypothetical protein
MSHSDGKRDEPENIKIMMKYGFVRPNSTQRKNLKNAWKHQGLALNPTGFDLIKETDVERVNNLSKFPEEINNIVLYELKSAGKNRKKPLGDNWEGFGFTLTGGEKDNANMLGDNYQFIFLNALTEKYSIFSLDDWFDQENARIYPSASIFIRRPLTTSTPMVQ